MNALARRETMKIGLSEAALRGDAEETARLLAEGAKPEAEDFLGRIPLIRAAQGGFEKVLTLLTEGLDANDENAFAIGCRAQYTGYATGASNRNTALALTRRTPSREKLSLAAAERLMEIAGEEWTDALEASPAWEGSWSGEPERSLLSAAAEKLGRDAAERILAKFDDESRLFVGMTSLPETPWADELLSGMARGVSKKDSKDLLRFTRGRPLTEELLTSVAEEGSDELPENTGEWAGYAAKKDREGKAEETDEALAKMARAKGPTGITDEEATVAAEHMGRMGVVPEKTLMALAEGGEERAEKVMQGWLNGAEISYKRKNPQTMTSWMGGLRALTSRLSWKKIGEMRRDGLMKSLARESARRDRKEAERWMEDFARNSESECTPPEPDETASFEAAWRETMRRRPALVARWMADAPGERTEAAEKVAGWADAEARKNIAEELTRKEVRVIAPTSLTKALGRAGWGATEAALILAGAAREWAAVAERQRGKFMRDAKEMQRELPRAAALLAAAGLGEEAASCAASAAGLSTAAATSAEWGLLPAAGEDGALPITEDLRRCLPRMASLDEPNAVDVAGVETLARLGADPNARGGSDGDSTNCEETLLERLTRYPRQGTPPITPEKVSRLMKAGCDPTTGGDDALARVCQWPGKGAKSTLVLEMLRFEGSRPGRSLALKTVLEGVGVISEKAKAALTKAVEARPEKELISAITRNRGMTRSSAETWRRIIERAGPEAFETDPRETASFSSNFEILRMIWRRMAELGLKGTEEGAEALNNLTKDLTERPWAWISNRCRPIGAGLAEMGGPKNDASVVNRLLEKARDKEESADEVVGLALSMLDAGWAKPEDWPNAETVASLRRAWPPERVGDSGTENLSRLFAEAEARELRESAEPAEKARRRTL